MAARALSSDDAVVSTDGVAGVAFADTWSITGQLTWNLFEGFFTQARVKETQALVETARANYDTQELRSGSRWSKRTSR
mgnify:CR=1 FL=1